MKRHKNRNVHPGEILKEDILVPTKLTVTAAAKSLQILRKTFSGYSIKMVQLLLIWPKVYRRHLEVKLSFG